MNSITDKIGKHLHLEKSEIVLLLGIILVSSYMLIESFSFPSAVRRFPLLAASATLICSVLLLFRSFLPSGMQKLVSESTQVVGGDQEIQQLEEEEDEVDIGKIYKTIGFIAGYGIASFLISLLYATPIFIAFHTRWTNQKWYVTVLLTGLMFGVGLLFMEFLNVPLNEGFLIGEGV